MENTASQRHRSALAGLISDAIDDGVGWVTIVGPAGIGKSHLAREIAARLGAKWITAGAITPDQIDLLGKGRAVSPLVILDGCDELAPHVVRGLRKVRMLRVIATSRAPIGAPDELLVRLPPMTLAEMDDVFSTAGRRKYLTTPPDPNLVDACLSELDGNPMAATLLAHRVRNLSLSSFLEASERLPLLSASEPDLRNPDQSCMTSALTRAWATLPKLDRPWAARLCVVEGRFNAKHVSFLTGLGEDDSISMLSRLVNHSWVRLASDGSHRIGHLHREFGLKTLSAIERKEALVARMRQLLQRVEPSARRLLGPKEITGASLIATARGELAHLFSLLQDTEPALCARAFLISTSLSDAGRIPFLRNHDVRRPEGEPDLEAELEAAYCARLGKRVLLEGNVEQGRGLLAHAEDLARQLGDPDLVVEVLLERIRSERTGDEKEVRKAIKRGGNAEKASQAHRARWLLSSAWLSNELSALEEALAALRLAGDEIGEARALGNLGLRMLRAKNFEAADRYGRESAKVAASAGNHLSEAISLNGLANARGRDERWRRSIRLYEKALSLIEGTGNTRMETVIYFNLGVTLHTRGGDLSEAAVHLSSARDLSELSDTPAIGALASGHLAALNAARGQLEAAAQFLKDANLRMPKGHAFLPVLRVLEQCLEDEPVAADPQSASGGDLDNLLEDAHIVVDRTKPRADAKKEATLVVAEDVSWFQIGAETVSLSEHPVTRRVLSALVRRHQTAAEVPLSTDAIFQAAWPEESCAHIGPARNRVWVQLAKLRKLGLREVLLRRAGGYLLSPTLSVVRHDPLSAHP